MPWTIFLILSIIWLLALVNSYTFGGFIQILLIMAIVVLASNLIQGRRAWLAISASKPKDAELRAVIRLRHAGSRRNKPLSRVRRMP
jgi:hypothetical protein